jgi:hypothetical protein
MVETLNARPGAPAQTLYFGRSGKPPLRLKGAPAGRDLVTLRAGDAAAGVALALWRRSPEGWAVSAQIDAEGAAPNHAWTADSPAAAAALAPEIARAAFAPPALEGAASLTEAADAACRRFAQIRMARLVGAWMAEAIDRLADAA